MRRASRNDSAPERHDHEFLEIDVVVGVLAAVEDVHHRHRQILGVGAAEVAVERQPDRVGGGVGDGQGDAEDGVGAELGLVGRAVQFDQQRGRVPPARRAFVAENLRGDDLVDVVDGLEDALAEIAFLVAVAQLDGLVGAGAGAAGDGGRPAEPSSRMTSTSSVGLPRLSRISRALMDSISIGLPQAKKDKGTGTATSVGCCYCSFVGFLGKVKRRAPAVS